jgi:isopentenyl-diphosphate delta-isomerase
MTDTAEVTSKRKRDHIQVNLEQDVQSALFTGFERYRFIHQALPELNLSEIDLTIRLLGKQLQAPLVISSMTGGTERARAINENLARAAQARGIAMGLGSQRAAIEDPSLAPTYQVRHLAPDILLFANLGAIQLNYRYGVDECRRAVEMIEADALILHLNAIQEAVQWGGDTNWAGLLKKIEQVCRALPVPVIGKEVGWGISETVARQLVEAGVAAIDVAGAGGTSWSEVERHLTPDAAMKRIAGNFVDWGIPTAESLVMVRCAAPDLPVIASGGLRTGIDAAKAVALGADAVAMASPFLKAATVSPEAVIAAIDEITHTLRIAMFGVGAGSITALKGTPHMVRTD